MTTICPRCHEPRATNKSGGIRRHGCQPPEATTFATRWSAPPLTKNMVRRLHHQREAQLRRVAIEEARWIIRAAMRRDEIRPMLAANIVLHWRQPDHRGRDGDGAQPTLSLLIDAMVLEGVLPNDSWQYVIHSGVTCHPPVRGLPGSLWVEITEPRQEEAS